MTANAAAKGSGAELAEKNPFVFLPADSRVPPDLKFRVANRSVLTVSGDFFTYFDFQILNMIFSVLSGKPRSNDWDGLSGPAHFKSKSALENYETLPNDAKQFLFTVLVNAESKRLNLFQPTRDELEKAQKKIKNADMKKDLPPDVAEYFSSLNERKIRTYVESVLRKITYERVRGPLAKNLSLTDISWFWHSPSQDEGKKK